MAQETHLFQPKFTLGEFDIRFLFLQTLKNNLQMHCMFLRVPLVYQNIFNKHEDEFIQKLTKHSIHEVYECSGCIGESKGDHYAITHLKHYLRYV